MCDTCLKHIQERDAFHSKSIDTNQTKVEISRPAAEATDLSTKEITTPLVRPKVIQGVTYRISTGHGKIYITVNEHEGEPFEIITTLGKSGGCNYASIESISRLASLALRSGVSPLDIAKQLRGIRCCPFWDDGVQVMSPSDAMAMALTESMSRITDQDIEMRVVSRSLAEEFMKKQPKPEQYIPESNKAGGQSLCPECGAVPAYQEGCLTCHACGWSKCD